MSCNVLADDAVYLPKDAKAPFSGYLLDEEKANKVRVVNEELSSQKRINSLLTEQIDTQKIHIQDNNDYIGVLSKRVEESKDSSVFSKAGYFLLGAAVTTLITFGVKQSVR